MFIPISRVEANNSSTVLVDMRGITKSYPGCLANDNVDLTIHAGRIHALLGENGAGKSTLVKVLYGLLQADAGEIVWRGNAVTIASPAKARDLGIALVFQHFSLFESMSVLENIAMGMASSANDNLARQIIDVSNRYGLPLDPERAVYTLSVGERQRIEIVRCLLQSPKLLIMDEPTSVLTPQEVNDLFVTLRRLAEEGVAILYISHKLNEIKTLCDEATILRGGKRVATADPREESAESLAALMMGSEVEATQRSQRVRAEDVRLQLNSASLSVAEQHQVPLRELQLSVHAGEIVGIAGVAGNGQDELMQAIAGEVKFNDPKKLLINGQAAGHLSPGERRQAGLCSVPEERLGHASVPSMSLTENAFLTAHHRLGLTQGLFLKTGKSRNYAEQVIQSFNVQCKDSQAAASSLSGGNLQKFIVGRELEQRPDVLVVSQPTWGVDAGAAAAIHRALQKLADEGAAVLVVSQDLDELMLISDRIGALCAGRLSQFYPTESVSVQQVGLLMGGATLDTDTVSDEVVA